MLEEGGIEIGVGGVPNPPLKYPCFYKGDSDCDIKMLVLVSNCCNFPLKSHQKVEITSINKSLHLPYN